MLGVHHPITVSMWALLDEWVGAEMELPSLLAPITHGAASCVFWIALCFHYSLHVAKTNPGQGLPATPHMTKLTEQLRLHIFHHVAPPIPAQYLPMGTRATTAAGLGGPKTPTEANLRRRSIHIQNNMLPNSAFRPFNKVVWLGTAIAKHPVPENLQGLPMCLSFHMCNMCNSDCPQAADHHAHTPAEDNAILVWEKIAFAPA